MGREGQPFCLTLLRVIMFGLNPLLVVKFEKNIKMNNNNDNQQSKLTGYCHNLDD